MNRRKFIKETVSFISVPLLLNGQAIHAWSANEGIDPLNPPGKVLVLIQLDGGNDGLNTLIPLDMYDNLVKVRKSVVLNEDKILPLTDLQGLHPSLNELKLLYEEEKLMFIQNVGYPQPNLSHFRSKEIVVSGSDSQSVVTSGWFGRYLGSLHPEYPENYPNHTAPHPLAISVGGSSSPTCQGELNNLSIVLKNLNTSYSSQSNPANFSNTPYGHELEYVTQVMLSTEKYLEIVAEKAELSSNISTFWPETGNNSLADKLKIVARLISGGLQTPIYVVNLGGFDTHANQVIPGAHHTGKHADLLKMVSEAVYAFQDELKLQNKEDNVLSLVYSEFGRRIASNDSDGTDHGAAFPMMLFGSKANPIVYGSNPVIPEEVEKKTNLKMETDFRRVYSSILSQWFNVDDSEINSILFNNYESIPILKSSVGIHSDISTPINKSVSIYPNPIVDDAIISFESETGLVILHLYSLKGELISKIIERKIHQGKHTLSFSRKGINNGQFILVYQNNGNKTSLPVTIMH